jgi:hypothetical protein
VELGFASPVCTSSSHGVAVRNKYRIKLVAFDAHYFYASTEEEVESIIEELDEYLTGKCEYNIYVYIETPLGHVRIK